MDSLKIASMNRRAFLAASAAGAFSTSIISALDIGRALAKEAMKGDENAAWYRFKIGDMEATVVSDGFIGPLPLAGALYPKVPKEDVDALVKSEFLSPEQFVIQENCLVLNTGDHLALIDTGRGAVHSVPAPAAGGWRRPSRQRALSLKTSTLSFSVTGISTIYRGSWARAASGSSPTLRLRSPRLNSISGPTKGNNRRPG